MARRTVLMVLLSSFCLSACGFKLAGVAELPAQLSALHLSADSLDNRQRKALQQTLEAAGATLVTQADAKAARLSVNLKTPPDRQLATSASSGEIVKRVSRSLDYSVKGVDGSLIVPPATLKQRRDVVLDENNLLASNRERETAVRELEQTLYDELVRQLSR